MSPSRTAQTGRNTATARRAAPRRQLLGRWGGRGLAVAFLAGTLAIAGCSSSAPGAADATTTTSTPPPSTIPTTTTSTSPPADTAASVSVACTRGDSLSDLGIDIGRVPFVDDAAPDDTAWVEIVMTTDNPTDQHIRIDPAFEITYVDASGAELAVRPLVDGTDPLYRDIVATDFAIGPHQSATKRVVVFDGYSGPLWFGEHYDLILGSLDSCELSSDPIVAEIGPYAPPAGVSLEISDCAPNEDGSHFTTNLTATNDSNEQQRLNVVAEVVDAAGDRIGAVGSYEVSVALDPGATETRSLEGSAWEVDDLSIVTGCELYVAEPVAW